jgi:hypothetical protein
MNETAAPTKPDAVAHHRRGRRDADPALLIALASGATPKQAAARTGLSLRTVQRRLGDPAFQAALARLCSDAVDQAIDHLEANLTHMADTLVALSREPHPPAIRLRAIIESFKLITAHHDAREITLRLDAIETKLRTDIP